MTTEKGHRVVCIVYLNTVHQNSVKMAPYFRHLFASIYHFCIKRINLEIENTINRPFTVESLGFQIASEEDA